MANGHENADLPSDVDAEGEDDMDIDLATEVEGSAVDGGDSDADGEAEEEELSEDLDAEGEEDEDMTKAEYHGAVKIRAAESEASAGEEDSDGQDSADAQSGSDEDSSESEAENEWEAGSGDAEEGEVDIAARNNCIFCGQDEENDPGEEFEEYLACAVCGDNSHRQCARENNSIAEDTEPSKWRCPSCTQNDFEIDGEDDANADESAQKARAESIQRRLSTSSHRLTRDLFPAVRGGTKPDAHSIFNTLIPEDDPADGSRSLRKRKASSDVVETVSRASSKRPKKGEADREESQSPVTTERARSGTAVSRARRTPAAPAEPATPAVIDPIATQASTRPQRQRRPKKEDLLPVRVLEKSPGTLIIAFRVDLSKIKLAPKRKRDRDRERNRNRNRQSEAGPARPRYAATTATPYTTPFFAFHEREEDEKMKKPYGGILSEADAANEKTLPDAADRAKFEKARRLAEEEWKERAAASEAEQEPKSRAAQKVAGPPSKIKCISFGGWEIDTWYAAPYPEEYSRNRVLYICEFCLKYMGSDYVAWRHKLKCPMKHPPGDEIYREDSVSVFEVDGRKNPAYCQNLCLLAKLFLGSKTLYYDVEPFLFYIMTEYDEFGCHFVGYFSKEKRPSSLNNVSCILTLPIHQRKGYGNLLIDFSYLLTKVEKKTGSPEKPLSDMGLVSYRNYWRLVLCYLLRDHEGPLSIADISDLTGMTADDIVAALEALRALVRDPVTRTYALRLDKAYFEETIQKWEAKGYVRLNPDALMWTPYVMGRSNLANYDRPALATIAPREGEEDEAIIPEEGVQIQQVQEAIGENGDADTLERGGKDIAESLLPPSAIPEPISEADNASPAKSPLLAILNGGGASKGPEETPKSPIPPTRYELYPPVAGTIYRAKRGGYRPKGSRITAHGPVFGNSPALLPPTRDRNRNRNRNRDRSGKAKLAKASDGAKASPSLRKTRSSLGTPLIDPVGDDDVREDEDRGEDLEESDLNAVDAVADADADADVGALNDDTNDASMQDAEGEDEEYVEGEDEDAEGEDEDVEEE